MYLGVATPQRARRTQIRQQTSKVIITPVLLQVALWEEFSLYSSFWPFWSFFYAVHDEIVPRTKHRTVHPPFRSMPYHPQHRYWLRDPMKLVEMKKVVRVRVTIPARN
jgi:hypothetical protein